MYRIIADTQDAIAPDYQPMFRIVDDLDVIVCETYSLANAENVLSALNNQV